MSRISKAKSVDVVASVAERLENLLDEVVFVGGSAAAFLISDESVVGVRPTLDVDLIVATLIESVDAVLKSSSAAHAAGR